MIKSTDIEARLRLFRYGLVVIVVMTFIVSLIVPYTFAAPYATEWNRTASQVEQNNPGMEMPRLDVSVTSFLGQAVLFTLVVAVLAVAIYFGYRAFLTRSAAPDAAVGSAPAKEGA